MIRVAHLYRITTPDGRAYIGVTVNMGARVRDHSRRDSPVGRAIRHHGRAKVTFQILAIGKLGFIRDYLEPKAIEAFGTRAPHGYNVTPGGTGGRNPLPATISKMAAAHRQRAAAVAAKGCRHCRQARRSEARQGCGVLGILRLKQVVGRSLEVDLPIFEKT
jgi:hypothetical protein